MSAIYTDAQKRHDFLFLFDVTDGNPNGDPDNDNLPRTDPETGQGLVTDVCLKRKIRGYVYAAKQGQSGFDIYIRTDRPLNEKHEEAHRSTDPDNNYGKKETKKDQKRVIEGQAQKLLCEKFFDVRTFGAVMTTGEKNCGQVRGPMQLTFSRSIDRVFSYDLSLTRQAVTTTKDFESKDSEMGRKALLPYGLYKGYGFYSPLLANRTGFSNDDLALFWDAMQNMFENDHSASRGSMAMHEVGIFSHDKPMGNAPSHKLFQQVAVALEKVENPRKYSDYGVIFPPEGEMKDFPGVSFKRLIG